MINKRYIRAIVLGLLISASSCDVLDIEPQTSLPAETAFNNRSAAEAGLIGAYSALQDVDYMGLRYFIFADLTADNLSHTGTYPSFAQIANRQILPDNVELSNIWNAIYEGINRANNLIAQVPNIEDPAFANKEEVIAQARFLRAYHYFNLINYWGGSPNGYGQPDGLGVPLRTEPTLVVADAAPVARASEAEVIAQVMADLDFAIENLSASAAPGLATQNAAIALKSRVLLYQGNYQEAADLTGQLIGAYTLPEDYLDIYQVRNTSESIWELQFDAVNSNSIAFFYFPSALGGRNEVSPSLSLNAAHEAGDERKDVNNTTSSYTAKYTRIADGTDHVMLIRYAEVLLNRAEALARLGQTEEAESLLNMVRMRAGLEAYTSTSQDDLISQILLDRRIELAHEGHRWFDLRRTGIATTVLGITDDIKTLWPIPQREILNAEGLVEQNPGY